MQLIGAALRHHDHLCAALSELRRAVAADHLEFLDSLRRRPVTHAANIIVLGVGDAIEREVGVMRAASTDLRIDARCGHRARVFEILNAGPRERAGRRCSARPLRGISAMTLLSTTLPMVGGFGPDDRRRRRNADALRDLADLEPQIDLRGLIDL